MLYSLSGISEKSENSPKHYSSSDPEELIEEENEKEANEVIKILYSNTIQIPSPQILKSNFKKVGLPENDELLPIIIDNYSNVDLRAEQLHDLLIALFKTKLGHNCFEYSEVKKTFALTLKAMLHTFPSSLKALKDLHIYQPENATNSKIDPFLLYVKIRLPFEDSLIQYYMNANLSPNLPFIQKLIIKFSEKKTCAIFVPLMVKEYYKKHNKKIYRYDNDVNGSSLIYAEPLLQEEPSILRQIQRINIWEMLNDN